MSCPRSGWEAPEAGECPFDERVLHSGWEEVVVANEIAVTNRAVVTYVDATYEWRCRVRTMRERVTSRDTRNSEGPWVRGAQSPGQDFEQSEL
jgi:hypothetical protein